MIGKLRKVEIRDIWKNEAKDFTTWLADNIDSLNDVLSTNLTVTETEKSVGSFYLDILAEDNEGKLAIIENQLEKTDHDHLGKVITYLTNLDANIAIWVSTNPRDEHKKAIDWLNETTPNDIAFYLVKIEAVEIGNSEPAPLFTVVSEPTQTSKEIGKEKKENSERGVLRKEFWAQLINQSKINTPILSNITPSIYHYINTSIGKGGISVPLTITYTSGGVEIYIDTGDGEINKKWFDDLYGHRVEIEKALGMKLQWERLNEKRASRIIKRFDVAGLKTNPEKLPELQDKMIDALIKFHKVFGPYIKSLKK